MFKGPVLYGRTGQDRTGQEQREQRTGDKGSEMNL